MGLKNKHFWLRGCGPSLCVYACSRSSCIERICLCLRKETLSKLILWWWSRSGTQRIVAAAAMLTKYWAPNDGAKRGKKAALRGPFRRPISGPQNHPTIGKGANCTSGIWPRFWGQIWCWKRVFSVCMCSLKWIRGVCICLAGWPGVKNTTADLCVQWSQTIIALCPLWWFQPPILQHVFSCALFKFIYIYIYLYKYTPYYLSRLFTSPKFVISQLID